MENSYRIRQKLLKVINLYQLVEEHDINSNLINKTITDFTKTFEIHVLNLIAEHIKDSKDLSDV